MDFDVIEQVKYDSWHTERDEDNNETAPATAKDIRELSGNSFKF